MAKGKPMVCSVWISWRIMVIASHEAQEGTGTKERNARVPETSDLNPRLIKVMTLQVPMTITQ